jgi:mRNA-degrading endonuclease RelE of RelBE toxin-antitoxin system
MKWRVDYSRGSEKFIEKQNIREEVREELRRFLISLRGENVNVDVKKLTGDWTGYYRLRKGKIRIIFSLNKSEKSLYVEKIDYRGDVYK